MCPARGVIILSVGEPLMRCAKQVRQDWLVCIVCAE